MRLLAIFDVGIEKITLVGTERDRVKKDRSCEEAGGPVWWVHLGQRGRRAGMVGTPETVSRRAGKMRGCEHWGMPAREVQRWGGYGQRQPRVGQRGRQRHSGNVGR